MSSSSSSSSSNRRIVSATIIGSGPSSGCPLVKCFVNPEWEVEKTCSRCIDGVHNVSGPNDRNNPSFLIQVADDSSVGRTSNVKNIIIDCGKTMRNSILKFFYPNNIRQLHQVILTHDHADAYLGMLDVAPLVPQQCGPIPLFSDQKTLKRVNEVFPECFISHAASSKKRKNDGMKKNANNTNKNNNNDSEKNVGDHQDADADEEALNDENDNSDHQNCCSSSFNTLPLTFPIFFPQLITAGQKFIVGASSSSNEIATSINNSNGVEVMPIYVLHGVNYFCLAFIFSLDPTGKLFDGADTLVYISDTGDVTDKSRNEILKYKTKVLILDLLKMEGGYISHFGHDGAIEEAKRIGAEKTFFIGYSHSVDVERCKKKWKEEKYGESFDFGTDGLRVF